MLKRKILIIIFTIIGIGMSKVFKPAWVNQGVGAKVIRIIGNQHLKRLDPFLMLDYFHVKLPAGFPDHPHRGFETVTYMTKGSFYHEDFKGHKGIIGPGDIQWMTAGKGIVHSQMPASYDQESVGFQLWINLKSDLKMIPPAYQQYTKDKIPLVKSQGAEIKVISGNWGEMKGPIHDRTPSYYFDIYLNPKAQFSIPIPKLWNTIIFVFEGQVIYQKDQVVSTNSCCILQKSEKDEITHNFSSEKGGRFMLIGGYPINQPIAQHGPFVMNNNQQLQETFKDYQTGKNGFEGADQWESKIKQLAHGKKIQQL